MKEILEKLQDHKSVEVSGVGSVSSKAYFLSKLFSEFVPGVIFYLVSDDSQKELVVKNLQLFSDYKILFLNNVVLDGSKDGMNRDNVDVISTLFALKENKKSIFVLTEEDLFRLAPDKKMLELKSFNLATDSKIDITDLFEKLLDMGYLPTPMTLPDQGTFLRRGGILDVFPVNSDLPIRIELVDDKVSSLHSFDPMSNKIVERLDFFQIYPVNIVSNKNILDYLKDAKLLVIDELEEGTVVRSQVVDIVKDNDLLTLKFVSFAETMDTECLRYSAVLRYHDLSDFQKDIRKKKELGWKVVISTERYAELNNFFQETDMVNDSAKIVNEEDFRSKMNG